MTPYFHSIPALASARNGVAAAIRCSNRSVLCPSGVEGLLLSQSRSFSSDSTRSIDSACQCGSCHCLPSRSISSRMARQRSKLQGNGSGTFQSNRDANGALRCYSSLTHHKSKDAIAKEREHSLLVNHSDLRLKQLTTKTGKYIDTSLTPQVLHEVRESIRYGTLGGKGLTYALKYLKENHKYKEAWGISIEAFENIPHHQLIKYIPAISVTLLMIARKLGEKETSYVVDNLINPQGANRLMWYSALNSIRETKDERVNHLFLKSYDKMKNELKFDEKGLAVLLQYFTTFGDMERSIEAFESRVLDENSPVYIKHRSPRLLSSYFHHLTVMGKRSKTRELVKDRIIHYYNTLCVDESKPNYVAPDPFVISKVLSSCTAGFDMESARDFFQDRAVPYMKQNPLHFEDASQIAFPLVVPWIKQADYNTVIWFYERYFSGENRLSEWNTPLLNMVMQAYYENKKYDEVLQIFEEYFASGKRVPSSKTFNILLLTKCIQDQSFGITEAMKTFHDYKNSLPTAAPIPLDYQSHLLKKKINQRTLTKEVHDGDYLDTKILKRRNIPPGLVKAVITSLVGRGNIEAAIQFFDTYCQDPTKEHFAMPPYRSIREITQGIVEVEKNAEKALSFLERAKVDARYTPPISIIMLLKQIYNMDESIDSRRIEAQLDRFHNLGAVIVDMIGDNDSAMEINEDEDETNPVDDFETEELDEEFRDDSTDIPDEYIVEERDDF